MQSESEVAQSCPTLSDPMDWSPPGSSIRGIFQASIWTFVSRVMSLLFNILSRFVIAFLPRSKLSYLDTSNHP